MEKKGYIDNFSSKVIYFFILLKEGKKVNKFIGTTYFQQRRKCTLPRPKNVIRASRTFHLKKTLKDYTTLFVLRKKSTPTDKKKNMYTLKKSQKLNRQFRLGSLFHPFLLSNKRIRQTTQNSQTDPRPIQCLNMQIK
jgi:hypothetical protein